MHQTAMTKAVAGRESLRHDRTYTPHTKGKEAMSAYTLDYTYTAPSALIDGADSRALSLATSGGSTPEGAASHPYFFSGFLERADVYATALLVVARVARTRFYVPPSSLAGALRAADPVVTSTAEGLRFESFSACCGVYARLDVDSSALDASHSAVGVTNVDVNPPLRAALASLRAGEPIHLNVGDDGMLTTTLDGSVMEEKVPLPIRWLKGFAETQMLSSRMSPVHSLDAAAARTFIHSLPRNSSTKAVLWATRAVRSLRLATRATAGSVCVAGPERLRVLEPLIRHIQRLDAYSEPVTAGNAPLPSVWVAHLPGARLSIGLSPEKSRGFSGEGSVLQALSNPNTAQNADMLSVLLSFEPRIDVPVMSARAGLDEAATRDALALLASSGQVGFDAHAGEYFHRPLPVHPEALTAMHPRLVGAKKLADSGAIERVGAGEHGTGEYSVRSGANTYTVVLPADPYAVEGYLCSCPWWLKYRGTRGPCKHALAVSILYREHAAN